MLFPSEPMTLILFDYRGFSFHAESETGGRPRNDVDGSLTECVTQEIASDVAFFFFFGGGGE